MESEVMEAAVLGLYKALEWRILTLRFPLSLRPVERLLSQEIYDSQDYLRQVNSNNRTIRRSRNISYLLSRPFIVDGYIWLGILSSPFFSYPYITAPTLSVFPLSRLFDYHPLI